MQPVDRRRRKGNAGARGGRARRRHRPRRRCASLCLRRGVRTLTSTFSRRQGGDTVPNAEQVKGCRGLGVHGLTIITTEVLMHTSCFAGPKGAN